MVGLTWTYADGTETAIGGGTVPAGLVETKTDPRENVWGYEYTASGDRAKETGPTGLITTYGHDAIGRQTSRTLTTPAHPGGLTTTFAYDTRGFLASRTEPAVENEVTEVTHTRKIGFTYDTDGRTLTETVTDLTGGDPQRQTTYTYSSHGQVATVTDPEGGEREFTWNLRGDKASVTDEVGTRVDYAYTDRGQLAAETLQDWIGSPTDPQAAADVVLTSRAYDPAGRLASSTDAMGRATRYIYGNDDTLTQKIADDARLNGSTTPRDVVLEDYLYDPAGNLERLVTGGGKTRTDYLYDAAGRLLSTTIDPTGLSRRTTYTHDASDNILSATATGAGGPAAELTSYQYDALGRVTGKTVENGAGDLVTTWAYGDRDQPTEITSPRGNAAGATRLDYTTLLRYDPAGQLVELKQPAVNVERAGGSPTSQRPVTIYGYNTSGEKTHTVDPEGRTTVTSFDKLGRPVSAVAPSYTRPGGTAVTPTTTIDYDDAGRPTTVTDPRGNARIMLYDALGRTVRVTDPPATTGATPGKSDFTYTLGGELLSAADQSGARRQATYDDLGRQITTTVIERKPTLTSLTSHAAYDDAGNLLSEQRPAGDITEVLVNALGEVTELTDPLGETTTFGYDLAGRQTTVTDPLGNSTLTGYDLAGRATTITDKDDSATTLRTRTIGYDLDGNPTTSVDAEGHTRTSTVDAIGRITQLVEPVAAGSPITTSFGYDAVGAKTRYTDGRGNATITTYNSLGLIESLIEPATAQHPALTDRTFTTGYDAAGNSISDVEPGGVTISRVYDNLGRLTEESGTGAAPTTTKTFGYDLAGRVTSAGDLTFALNDRGNLLKTTKAGVDQATFAYDANGRLAQRGDAAGATTFTWDGDDRLTTTVDPLTGVTVSYDYDDADRLTTTTYGSGGPQRTYTYDALDRVITDTLTTGAEAGLASIAYGYDHEDRLTSKTTTGTAGAGANTYTYDFAGRLTSWTDPASATTAYAWDASGNRTQAGGQTYTYDQRNRLTSGAGTDYTYTARGTLATATTSGVTTTSTFDAFNRLITDGDITYAYDALDRMTTRTQSADTTKYLYADTTNDLSAVTDAAGVAQEIYNRGPDGAILSSKTGAAAAQFQMADRHRDIVAGFTAAAATLSGSTAYNPFGTIATTSGTRPQLGYQSAWTDSGSGKANMAARWYQPATGSFASRDSVTLPEIPSAQANRYTYAGGSPTNYIDPTGHWWENPNPDMAPVVDVAVGDTYMSGYLCSGNTCVETDAHAQWWTGYMDSVEYREAQPQLSNREAKRIGYMANGHPAPDGYWGDGVSQTARDTYSTLYNIYIHYDDRDLAGLWKDLSSQTLTKWGAATMVNLAKAGVMDSRTPTPSCVAQAGGRPVTYCAAFPKLLKYIGLLKYETQIRDAAAEHRVDPVALTALLIYENQPNWEPSTTAVLRDRSL